MNRGEIWLNQKIFRNGQGANWRAQMVTGVIERSKVAGEVLKAAGSLGFSNLDGRLGLKNTLSDHKKRLQ